MTALEWAISQEHYHVADFLRRYSTLASASRDSASKVRRCAALCDVLPYSHVSVPKL